MPIPPNPPHATVEQHADVIENVLDHSVVLMRTGGFQKLLVKWQGRSETDCAWITEAEVIESFADYPALTGFLSAM